MQDQETHTHTHKSTKHWHCKRCRGSFRTLRRKFLKSKVVGIIRGAIKWKHVSDCLSGGGMGAVTN